MKIKLHILLVEDSPDDALLIERDLRRAGYEINCERVETENALKQALKDEKWDAVLCDYTLPKFDGDVALHLVREADADLPFIYVSGTIGEDVAVEAMKRGANDYVLKKQRKRLAPAIARVLRESRLRHERTILEADRARLVVELTAALEAVKRLSGLLPLCACCKRIRNEHNEWQVFDVYVQKHPEAQFNRGVCPNCLPLLGCQVNQN